MQNQLPHVVIVGAGFGGLRAARAFKGQPVRVTLVDRNNYHLFQPLLYQVATAAVSPSEIAYPVRAVFRRQSNLTFTLADVTCIDAPNRRLVTSAGPIDYDYLILAPGGETNYFGNPALEGESAGLKNMDDAVALRNHLLNRFEQAAQTGDEARRGALLTFVIVGGGPTGVEMAGSLAELVKLVLATDFPYAGLRSTRILLIEMSDQLLPGMPPKLAEHTRHVLRRKGVEMRFGATVTGYDGENVTIKGGNPIPAGTLIWAAGIRAAPLLATLGVPLGRSGRVVVTPALQVAQHPEVFVIGDAAYLEDDGQPLPMVAPVAMQQADTAAANVLRTMRGEPLAEFEYKDPGQLATIGRSQAVARLGRFQFTGFAAWVVWLVVHLIQLIGFRNKLFVLVNWAYDYIQRNRPVRLILGGEEHKNP